MKRTGILVLFGITVIMMSLIVSASTLLIDNGLNEYTVGETSILNMDKCVCPECAMVDQEVSGVIESIWLCDTCLCPHYIDEGPDRMGWYLFAEDICMTEAIKWKSLGWVLAVNNKCTNFELFGEPCKEIRIPDTEGGNRVIVCGNYTTG